MTALVLVVFGLAGVTARLSDVIPNAGYLSRDPNGISHVPWWTGALSLLTTFAWGAAAAANLLATVVARGRARRRHLLLGAFCVVLGLDDALQFHEVVLPGWGVPERAVMACYAVAGVLLLLQFWPVRRTAVAAAFFAGVVCQGLSVLIDQATDAAPLPEDTAKMLGVAAWILCGAWAVTRGLEHLRDDHDPDRPQTVDGGLTTAPAAPLSAPR